MGESAVALLVRRAELADAAAIASSHVRSWQAGYADVISSDFLRDLGRNLPQHTLHWQMLILGGEAEGRFMLVGEVDGEVAGHLSGGAYRGTDASEPPRGGAYRGTDAGEPPPGEVYACYVDPAHWRQGVGSALMAHALERLAQAGYSQAALWVLADNVGARAFYEHHGWLADGAHKIYELAGERYPEVRYHRALP
jgi:GNAT superfamily N-acetyltransferase